MLTDNQMDWKTEAVNIQKDYCNILGSRLYDVISKSDLFCLKKKVGYATCGKSSELPKSSNYYTGYNANQIEYISKVCTKIIEKSEGDSIRFACTMLVLHHENEIGETPVFRIGTNQKDIFIDANARVYRDWEHFMKDNKLPACEYCFPVNGNYWDSKSVDFKKSPASSVVRKAINVADTAGTVVALAGAGVFAASILATVGPTTLAVAGATSACTGVYNASRSIFTLVDRKQHEQPVNLKDSESRGAWLSIGSSAVGIGATAAVGKAQSIVQSGKPLSKLATCGIHALTATSIVFSGFGFVESLSNCIDKFKRGVLNKKDVFDLSCELLFLFNAVASAKATTELVKNMSAISEGSISGNKKLTKTQKRNLRRRAAKRRAKGLSPLTKPEDSNKANELFTSNTFKKIFWRAAYAFIPRLAEIQYKFEKIGHDFQCYKNGEITVLDFISRVGQFIDELFNELKDEIADIFNRVQSAIKSFAVEKQERFCQLYKNSTNKQCKYFHIILINMKDEIDNMMSEAEQEISILDDEYLENGNIEDTTDFNTETPENAKGGNNDDTIDCNTENPDNNECTPNSNVDGSENDNNECLSSEFKCFLSKSVDFIPKNTCNDLEDFGSVLMKMKCSIVNDFKKEVKTYVHNRRAAQSSSVKCDISKYNEALGIKGEPTQYFLNKTIESVNNTHFTSFMKNCENFKRETEQKCIPLWNVATEGIYFSYGAIDLSEKELLKILSKLVNKDLTDENCKLLKIDKDIIRVEYKEPNGNDSKVTDNGNINIIVTQKLDEENNAFAFITILS